MWLIDSVRYGEFDLHECSRLVVCDYELVCEHCDGWIQVLLWASYCTDWWIQVWVCYELVCVTGEYKYETMS